MFSRYREQYEQLWKMFIRPPRITYSLMDLGPSIQSTAVYSIKRIDFEIKNKNNFLLKCSFFQRIDNKTKESPGVCVIYLHGNSGCRIDGLSIMPSIIESDMNFCCFDFSGCGLSEGEFISLGYHEKDDVILLKSCLREKFGIKEFGLWGRSMGAVTAIHAASRDNEFFAMVCDSPFLKLERLAIEMAKERNQYWFVVTSIVMSMVKKSIKKRARFSLDSLDQASVIQKCKLPILFVCSKDDKFVKPYNTEELYKLYKGKKFLSVQPGDHNSNRTYDFLVECNKFLKENFLEKVVPELKNIPQKNDVGLKNINPIKRKVSQQDIIKKFSCLNQVFDNNQGGNAFPMNNDYKNYPPSRI